MLSFPRRREPRPGRSQSNSKTIFCRDFRVWVPAFAGMTYRACAHSSNIDRIVALVVAKVVVAVSPPFIENNREKRSHRRQLISRSKEKQEYGSCHAERANEPQQVRKLSEEGVGCINPCMNLGCFVSIQTNTTLNAFSRSPHHSHASSNKSISVSQSSPKRFAAAALSVTMMV
jgi:hypothetical protein